MGGKARVHELAKELGVTSKEVLARLAANGEWVKSASSTVEAGVARRLREAYGVPHPSPRAASGKDRQRAAGSIPTPLDVASGKAQRQRTVDATPAKPKLAGGKRQSSLLTSADALDIYRSYRLAEASAHPSRAIDELLRACEVKYGLSRKGLERIVAKYQGHISAMEFTPRNRRTRESRARNQAKAEAPQDYGRVGVPQSTPHEKAAAIARPRGRAPGLPPLAATMNLEGVRDIVAGKTEQAADREAILTFLQQLASNRPDEYTYLTWRYASIRRTHSEPRLTTAHQDLIALAVVIDQERQLLDTLVRAHGSILAKPGLAERGLEEEFRSLISADGGERSPDTELRHTRAASDFLRRAVVLAISSADNGQRLWEMLGVLKLLTSGHIETSLRLEGARRRLTDQIGTVERLLSTDDATLARFFLHSRASLAALQLKRYDFLRPFRDSAVGLRALARQATPDLAFQVLPQGGQLRRFLGEVRASKRYSGYRIDEHRLILQP